MRASALGCERDADIRLKQWQEVALAGDRVLAAHIDVAAAQVFRQLVCLLAMTTHNDPFSVEIGDLDAAAIGQTMVAGHHDTKSLAEQRPAVDPVPGISQRRGRNPKLGLSSLEELGDFGSGPAHKLQLKPIEHLL